MIEHNRPQISELEFEAVQRVLKSGQLAQGQEVGAFEAEFAARIGVNHAVAVANGTVALEIGLQTLGVGPGDQVIVPSFTFVATANAVRRVGAEVVFADIEPSTFCVSAETVAPLITKRTRAVIAVHLYGHPADVDSLQRLCRKVEVALLEDSAQGLGATWRGRAVGSFGALGTFSLYATKNITTGEGGMITTDDPTIADLACSLRAHQNRWAGGSLQVASNARMTDIQAALGRVQLGKLDEFQRARHRLAEVYERSLSSEVATPYVAPEAVHGYHQYTIRTPERERLERALKDAGVGYGLYYPVPIHLTETYKADGVALPETEQAATEVISLPIRPDLTAEEQQTVIQAVNEWKK